MNLPSLPTSKVIGILAQEFLVNVGANDFLKNLIRGLNLIQNLDIIFICPPHKSFSSNNIPLSHDLIEDELRSFYKFYSEACSRMRFIESVSDSESLLRLQDIVGIDIFFPSIYKLSKPLKYITYWPDCQPKHYPQFFDDESQLVRDKMIFDLLDSEMPMIINSAAAKLDMIKYYEADPRQIFSLPFAPIIEFSSFTSRPELISGYNLPSNFFLVSNQFWIHKSVETVLETIRLGLDNGNSFNVVFTGRMEEPRKPEYIDWIHSRVEQLNISCNVMFLGYIPKSHQIEIMKLATAVIQPTLFEGGPGGGSVYDAISIGTRAIITDIEVNKEIAKSKSQVIYFTPKDHQMLLQCMIRFSREKWIFPCVEDLFQQSTHSCLSLARTLVTVIKSLTH